MTQVIILNSGTGSRMKELTANRPKCLVELGDGETILGRQLRILKNFDLDNILITTGPFEEMIKAYAASRPEKLRVKLVHNPAYDRTNYIYSLLLAGERGLTSSGEEAGGEVIVMHGDLIFDEEALGKLLQSGHDNAVLVNTRADLPVKDFKAELEGGLVSRIGVDLFGPNCAFLIPLYRLSGKAFAAWLKEMELFRSRGKLQVYAEEALNNLLPALGLYPVDVGGRFCMEIDDPKDLEKARKNFYNR